MQFKKNLFFIFIIFSNFSIVYGSSDSISTMSDGRIMISKFAMACSCPWSETFNKNIESICTEKCKPYGQWISKPFTDQEISQQQQKIQMEMMYSNIMGEYTFDHNGGCDKRCDYRYGSSATSFCICPAPPPIQNCINPSTGSPCIQCEQGYLLSTDGKICQSCPSNAICDGTKNFSCRTGFTKSADSCIPPITAAIKNSTPWWIENQFPNQSGLVCVNTGNTLYPIYGVPRIAPGQPNNMILNIPASCIDPRIRIKSSYDKINTDHPLYNKNRQQVRYLYMYGGRTLQVDLLPQISPSGGLITPICTDCQ